MNRPLFRARNLDPNKRIPLLVDQHDDNNNDLTNSSTKSASSSSLLVSLSSTPTITNQTTQNPTGSTSQLPQRCVSQMPFVSGMEREEEAEYHLQNALDAQCRLGSAKIRAVPIPNLYEDQNSKFIYPNNNQLPKQLIRLQPLQLESDDPQYDMDEVDHNWFHNSARSLCPDLTYLEYETIIDKLENASTRTLVSLDEARALFASSTPPIINDLHINTVYEFWYKRRTTRGKRLKPRLLTERDIKEEKGKHHPYVAFRRRVEKMTTRKNRKNDEQAYMSMLKLRSSFETVVKLTNLIKLRETTKVSWLECALAIFQARCESKPDDETTSTTQSSTSSLSTNHDRHHHARSHLKTSSLINNNSSLTAIQRQQLLTQLLRIENHKKNPLTSSTLAGLLQTPIQSRSLSNDSYDPLQRKIKKFKSSHKKSNQTDKLTQLLSSPTTPSSPVANNIGRTSTNISPQSLLERLSSSNVASSPSQQLINRRRLKNSLSGTHKQGKTNRNLSPSDLWSLVDNTSGGAILFKGQLLEVARKIQQKEELENNANNRRVILQDGSSVLSNTNENIDNRLDDVGTSIDDDESIDPWQFRPKSGCRYLRPIDQDQQQRVQSQCSSFSSFYSLACSERGHLGNRRVRIGRGGRLLYDRHIEQENSDFSSITKSYFTDKPVLWYVSPQPSLAESYHLHSHLTVHDHTTSLAHHYQSKSSPRSIELNDSFYHVNNSNPFLSLTVNGKHRPSVSIEPDHPYSCSSRHINQALRTLVEPQLPTPPPSFDSTTPTIYTPQKMILVSTPPPLSSSMTNNQRIDTPQQPCYTKSSAYTVSPSTPFYPSHHHSHTIPSTPPPPPSSSSATSSCALVQFVQLHRILPSTKTHNFASSSTPVTTSDS
ncbi:unnamed protein product [Rotaria magnacalcarata]|uniref:Enhancer of polycomb-like protein n=3 Tax=Rotaria magnacalcarata TaxID=392030 RepID=A0A814ITZ2_9BILA|nr:unnamed protein product [Rotaria magnacalcarata]CAF1488371.1 unnamed protein product [Rotaria magnacalcarata]